MPKTAAASSKHTGNKALKRPASAQKKPQPKPSLKSSKGKSTHKELKMDRKNVHPRAYHGVRKKIYRQTGDDELACRKASAAAKKAFKAVEPCFCQINENMRVQSASVVGTIRAQLPGRKCFNVCITVALACRRISTYF